MVLVEFFDRAPIKNLAGAITSEPEKVIFLGERKQMERQRASMEGFLREMGSKTVLELRNVVRTDLGELVAALKALAERETDLVLDLTGGDELSMVAAGMVYGASPAGTVGLRRYNVATGKYYALGMDGMELLGRLPGLTVEQNIRLHGGAVVHGDRKRGGTEHWVLTREFREDLEVMWEICRMNCSMWNTRISALGALIRAYGPQEDILHFQVNVPHAVDLLGQQRMKFRPGELYPDLQRAGLIRNLRSDSLTFSFDFKNAQVMRVMAKAGTLLELITWQTAMDQKDRSGKPLFDDAMTGVVIDWDGAINAGADTENEVDVVLMRGMRPLFLSCKNGAVGHEELYKLHTVATRFGGEYAKKVLIATTYGRDAENRAYLQGRARDMDITIIDSVHELTGEAFGKRLRELV